MRDVFGARRVGDSLAGYNRYVFIIVLDCLPESVVALVSDIVLGVMEDPGDLPLVAQRFCKRIGRLFSHLEQVISNDRYIIHSLLVACRDIRQEYELYALLFRDLKSLCRTNR